MGESKRRRAASGQEDLERVFGDFYSIHEIAVGHVGRTHSLRMTILRDAVANKAKHDALVATGDRVAIDRFVREFFRNPVIVFVWQDPDPRVPDMIAMVAQGSNLVAAARTYRRHDPPIVALEVQSKEEGELLARLFGDWPSDGVVIR